MPLVEHMQLPTFSRLRQQGQEVLSLERAEHQDIRELHIGILNMMPDAALEATERQFIRLVGNCNRIAQFYVYPFSLPEINRSRKTQDYIEQYYCKFEDLKKQGLDALIITGANPSSSALEDETFWQPLAEVVNWADRNVASTLCSCLASHAILKQLHGIERQALSDKCWGVFNHHILAPQHPLLRDINTRFDVPHSRHNEISAAQFEQAGLTVLVASRAAGVQMAVSADQFRMIFFQGHPEYDINSLLKEYKREVQRYLKDELTDTPAYPSNYFSPEARQVAQEFLQSAKSNELLPVTFEDQLQAHLDNTWGDTAKAIVSNWLGLVYQVTNLDRSRQFMDGINAEDPLGIRSL
ncbi:MAG: homoserine O-succinyltransferase [Xanthomonadales bacterium]|nr:homoserine O-succinyltransferase [Xanthomonadales bacterium]